jgi:hypothetical protein
VAGVLLVMISKPRQFTTGDVDVASVFPNFCLLAIEFAELREKALPPDPMDEWSTPEEKTASGVPAALALSEGSGICSTNGPPGNFLM